MKPNCRGRFGVGSHRSFRPLCPTTKSQHLFFIWHVRGRVVLGLCERGEGRKGHTGANTTMDSTIRFDHSSLSCFTIFIISLFFPVAFFAFSFFSVLVLFRFSFFFLFSPSVFLFFPSFLFSFSFSFIYLLYFFALVFHFSSPFLPTFLIPSFPYPSLPFIFISSLFLPFFPLFPFSSLPFLTFLSFA